MLTTPAAWDAADSARIAWPPCLRIPNQISESMHVVPDIRPATGILLPLRRQILSIQSPAATLTSESVSKNRGPQAKPPAPPKQVQASNVGAGRFAHESKPLTPAPVQPGTMTTARGRGWRFRPPRAIPAHLLTSDFLDSHIPQGYQGRSPISVNLTTRIPNRLCRP